VSPTPSVDHLILFSDWPDESKRSGGPCAGNKRNVFAVLVLSAPAKAADDGESTYKAQCMKCHGANGDGNGNGHAQMKIKPADLRSDAVQQLSDEELYKTIAYGVGHKDYAHAFAERGLSSKQIADFGDLHSQVR